MSRRRTKAPPLVGGGAGADLVAEQLAAAHAPADGTRRYPTSRGLVIAGVVVHVLERRDLERAYAGALLVDPVNIDAGYSAAGAAAAAGEESAGR